MPKSERKVGGKSILRKRKFEYVIEFTIKCFKNIDGVNVM